VLKGVLPAGAVFPFDFGFVPCTRAEDGDPLGRPGPDGCAGVSRVHCAIATRGCDRSRTDRRREDGAERSTPGGGANSAAHRSIHDLRDLSADLVAQIEHFFVSYNEMKGKRFQVKGQAGKKRALTLVTAALTKRRRR
jgi:inorganic pyrophosphatase